MDNNLNQTFVYSIVCAIVKRNSFLSFVFNLIVLILIFYTIFRVVKYLLFTTSEEIDDFNHNNNNVQYQGPLPTGDKPKAPYPNGWIPACESQSVGKEKIKTVKIFGGDLVVFRGASGQAYVIDAYCPHLGAHFGYGGRVLCHKNATTGQSEDCIRCPFHAWSFSGGDGKCIDIPYSSSIPEQAKVKVWKTVELNGFIYVWYHADGEEPSWQLEEVPEIKSKEWKFVGRGEHFINCYIQEISENGADIQHLPVIHKPLILFGGNLDKLLKLEFLSEMVHHHITAAWQKHQPPDNHISSCFVTIDLRFFHHPVVDVKVDIRMIGPAILWMRVDAPLGFKCIYVEGIIPIAPKRLRFVRLMYSTPIVGCLVAWPALWAEARFFARDVYVWNRKVFLRKPLAVKEEKSLLAFRRWYNQFFSEKSLDW